MIVTLTKVSRKEKQSAKGNMFISLGIQTEEHGEKWLSGFGNASNASWVPGQKVAIEITEKGDYLNFTEASVWDAIADMDKRIKQLEGNHKGSLPVGFEEASEPIQPVKQTPIANSETTLDVDDFPF